MTIYIHTSNFVCFVQDFTEYTNFEEGLAYIEDYMVNNGPFEGSMSLCHVKRYVGRNKLRCY